MNWKEEIKAFVYFTICFILVYFLPVGTNRFDTAIHEALMLLKWYAREHVLLCLIPAFFIAGTISIFVSQSAVITYFGPRAKKLLAYAIASISGAILAVCSCTILPLFSSIHKRGAGLGPAITFLYSGPAINILAIILTMKILGPELGIARAIGAILFSIIIGIIMEFLYRNEETKRADLQFSVPESTTPRPLWQTAIHFSILVAILVFVNLAKPDVQNSIWLFLYSYKWLLTAVFGVFLALSLLFILRVQLLHVIGASVIVLGTSVFFHSEPLVPFVAAVLSASVVLAWGTEETQQWLYETWSFAKQILPLLAGGILLAGFLLGGPETKQGIIPKEWIVTLVGGNSFFANFFASIFGAFMYFATLTEVPIVQGLLNSGMGKGPALALLLAGPAISLPSMLVIRSVIGTPKTIVYSVLVITIATLSGMIFGSIESFL
ncbi:MAG: permease [Bacteroidetes bacterium]|nr:permease [Bacteroidota bacterium]